MKHLIFCFYRTKRGIGDDDNDDFWKADFVQSMKNITGWFVFALQISTPLKCLWLWILIDILHLVVLCVVSVGLPDVSEYVTETSKMLQTHRSHICTIDTYSYVYCVVAF